MRGRRRQAGLGAALCLCPMGALYPRRPLCSTGHRHSSRCCMSQRGPGACTCQQYNCEQACGRGLRSGSAICQGMCPSLMYSSTLLLTAWKPAGLKDRLSYPIGITHADVYNSSLTHGLIMSASLDIRHLCSYCNGHGVQKLTCLPTLDGLKIVVVKSLNVHVALQSFHAIATVVQRLGIYGVCLRFAHS